MAALDAQKLDERAPHTAHKVAARLSYVEQAHNEPWLDADCAVARDRARGRRNLGVYAEALKYARDRGCVAATIARHAQRNHRQQFNKITITARWGKGTARTRDTGSLHSSRSKTRLTGRR